MSRFAISSNREVSGGGSIPALKRELSKKKSEIVVLNVQLSNLQSQLDEAIADLAQAQAALSAAQAQIAADAVTIAALQAQVASLTAQVASLQAQIAALQNPIYYRFISTAITIVGGGVNIPPYYYDPIIPLNAYITSKAIALPITKVGGSYP